MYIQANQCEREVSIHKITNPEHGILDVVRELYAQIRDLEGFEDEEDIDHLDIDSDILFNNEDSKYPENYENLQKLKYFLQFPVETFLRLQKEQYLRIWTQYDPMYSIEIQFKDNHYSFDAYSNIENNYMWDKIMEYVE
jgi:hypothetical protein